MKVDRELLAVNHALTETLKDLGDFNTILLRTVNELLIENERLSKKNKELETRIDTLKSVNNRHREEIHRLEVDKRILIRKLEDLEV